MTETARSLLYIIFSYRTPRPEAEPKKASKHKGAHICPPKLLIVKVQKPARLEISMAFFFFLGELFLAYPQKMFLFLERA